MKSPAQTSFGAVFRNEVLLNSKRVAPYALMVLFSGNAILWSVAGAAVSQGWATNSDYYIVRNFLGFCFITGLPLFAAVIMGDPVIRDFRAGVDPLIFSKPVSRASYLLGKFFGSFFVLVCCQAAFALTLIVLQVFHTSRMVVLPVRVLPYFKHFFLIVVISYLLFAAVYFTLGTLTRNAKIVYAAAVLFYPIYIAYQVILLKDLPLRWRNILDPILFHRTESVNPWESSADYLNSIVVGYSSDMIVNRALVVLAAGVCLTLLYFRFSITARSERAEAFYTNSILTGMVEGHFDTLDLQASQLAQLESVKVEDRKLPSFALPSDIKIANEGFVANLNKLVASLVVEFRLLGTERSLVVLVPLVLFLSTLEIVFYEVVPDASYSVTYARSTSNGLLLFLLGIIVFYTGESMRRDREVRVEPFLWATPAPNSALLLSKFLATFLLTLSLIAMTGLVAIVIQFVRGHTPVETSAFLLTYSVVLVPGIIFVIAVSIALNVLLRDKYLAYAVSIATAAGLFYLYSQGYNHWLYNPLLYQLWSYADLTGAGRNQSTILLHRLYCLGIAGGCLSLAHLFFARKSTRALRTSSRLTSRGWSILILIVSTSVALIAGLSIG